jgi:disulfide oxidoreductase YuzD
MKSYKPIKVTIFDYRDAEHCSRYCAAAGDDVAFVTEHLERKYGDTVQVEYIDLGEENSEMAKMVRAQNLSLPVVAINGVLRLAGSVEYRAIMEAIEAQIEVGGGWGL